MLRFVPFRIGQDRTAEPVYEAVRVSGDDKECGQSSDEWITPHPVEVWMREHSRDTGHTRFRRAFVDCADVSRPDRRM